MSPRDRDHYRGGKSSLIIENVGTGNQAIKPKLASFRKQLQPASPSRLGLASFRYMAPDRNSAQIGFVSQKRNQPVRAAPDELRSAAIVPDRNSAKIGFVSQKE